MKPSEAYFQRNQGDWHWKVDFTVSHRKLWQARLKPWTKLRVSLFALAQAISGPFTMKTQIQLEAGASLVRHSTEIAKGGVTFYRSEKKFHLDEDGRHLTLTPDSRDVLYSRHHLAGLS